MSTEAQNTTSSQHDAKLPVGRIAPRKAQVIKCKCGSTFAACVEPNCYTDSDWKRDLSKYVKMGFTVEILDCGLFRFEKCKCKEIKASKDAQLSFF